MKRVPIFAVLFLFVAVTLSISIEPVHAQRLQQRTSQSSRQSSARQTPAERHAKQNTDQPTQQEETETSPTEPSISAPEPEPTTNRSADVSAPTPASRGVALEFVPSQLVTKPRSWAILIGVNDYVKLANLSYCVNDVKAIETSLLQTDFDRNNVFTLTSGAAVERDLPTRNNIVQVIQLVSRSASSDDFVFIALNGHGVQIGDAQYFCPSDMDDQEERLAETAISIDWVYKTLEESNAKFKLLVVDACRDNPFKGRRSALVADMGITRDPPPGIALIRSCGPGEVSLEDSSFQKGIFTHYLLEGLSGSADVNEDGMISFLELYMYTQSKTQTYALRNHRSQQNPYIKGEVSDFPFAHGYAGAANPNTAATPTAAESQRSDPQAEVMLEMIAELRTLREERNAANQQAQDQRIAELEQQIEAARAAPPRQTVQTTQRLQSQPISRSQAVQMVNQHNAVAPGASKITGATRQELIQHVQQQGALPRELLQTLPNRQQPKSRATYR
ncbi:MAG: caspase family protein [Planctomycetaceae bacterium]|jgi:uncharacterized caspase-like protein|nr:caspase family protein [Planctomycetaceae bacterium]